jgi:hypothetical protein
MTFVANRRICGLSQPLGQRRGPFAWSVRRADRCPLLTACSPRAHSMRHVTAWVGAWQSHILDAMVLWRRVERPTTRLVGPHGPKTTNLIMATNGYRIVDAADATRRQEIATLLASTTKDEEGGLATEYNLGSLDCTASNVVNPSHRCGARERLHAGKRRHKPLRDCMAPVLLQSHLRSRMMRQNAKKGPRRSVVRRNHLLYGSISCELALPGSPIKYAQK